MLIHKLKAIIYTTISKSVIFIKSFWYPFIAEILLLCLLFYVGMTFGIIILSHIDIRTLIFLVTAVPIYSYFFILYFQQKKTISLVYP